MCLLLNKIKNSKWWRKKSWTWWDPRPKRNLTASDSSRTRILAIIKDRIAKSLVKAPKNLDIINSETTSPRLNLEFRHLCMTLNLTKATSHAWTSDEHLLRKLLIKTKIFSPSVATLSRSGVLLNQTQPLRGFRLEQRRACWT